MRTSRCEHTRDAVNSKELSATTQVLTLRETFQIARGAADEETVVVAELATTAIVARGEGAPVDYWGETPEGIVAALEADGLALLGDDLFAGEAILRRDRGLGRPAGREDGARRDRPRLARQAPRAADLARARDGPGHAADLVHDRDRLGRGHRGPRRRATGYEVLKIKVGGPGDVERLRAVRAQTTRAAADRRQRGLGPRDRPRR